MISFFFFSLMFMETLIPLAALHHFMAAPAPIKIKMPLPEQFEFEMGAKAIKPNMAIQSQGIVLTFRETCGQGSFQKLRLFT